MHWCRDWGADREVGSPARLQLGDGRGASLPSLRRALIVIPARAAGSARSQGFQPWWRQARMA